MQCALRIHTQSRGEPIGSHACEDSTHGSQSGLQESLSLESDVIMLESCEGWGLYAEDA
jgi:hypothetical protein